VLLALSGGPLHGYAIMQAFEDLSGGTARLLPGTLYATLARMVETGLIEETDPPAPDADARRRYYGLTAWGRSVARAESERLRRLLDVAAAVGLTGAWT
jgi:DNA-binding PadR family transcriptional regulator